VVAAAEVPLLQPSDGLRKRVVAIASSFCARISRREASFSPNFHHSGGPDGRECQKTMGWQKHYADVRIMPTCAGNPACGAGIAAMESA
jgi:hypothetical protein